MPNGLVTLVSTTAPAAAVSTTMASHGLSASAAVDQRLTGADAP
jgi:hypothetical protein